jgi:hypothetical protein
VIVGAVFFIVRETTYSRSPGQTLVSVDSKELEPTIDIAYGNSVSKEPAKMTEFEIVEVTSVPSNSDSVAQLNNIDTPETLRQRIRLFRGRITDRSSTLSFFQPFPFVILPSIVFSIAIHGAYVAWTVVTTILQHQVLLYAPYNMQPDILSYISLPGSLVNLLSSIFSGWLSDTLIQFLARRNNGIYEPEFRLLMMIPATIFSTLGFALMGPLYEQKASVAKLVICGLLFHVANPFASISTIPYIFDTMTISSTEAFVGVAVFRHVFIFLVSSYVPGWFAKVGPIRVHQIFMMINLAVSGSTLILYMFGKKLRGWVRAIV